MYQSAFEYIVVPPMQLISISKISLSIKDLTPYNDIRLQSMLKQLDYLCYGGIHIHDNIV